MAFTSVDPATGERVAEYDEFDDAAVERALDRGAQAARAWAETPLTERLAVVARAGEVLTRERDALAALITLEMGKLPGEARAEVEKCALGCRFYADRSRAWLADDAVETDASRSLVAHAPLGLVLAVMPWNFPFWQVFRFAAPTLAAGNAAVLKHASNVPQCALAIERVWRDAGAPDGLFQTLLVGSGRVDGLIGDDRVRAVTLTGSEGAGRSVGASAGKHLKPCVLELGGSDAFVVLDDADIARAAEVGVKSRFQNAGQSCIAAKRFIVDARVYDEFCAAFTERAAALECGPTLAPVARHDLRDGLHAQVERTLAAGARVAIGGRAADGPGAYYLPTVLTGVERGMPAADEETFGPVAAILRCDGDDHALELANASRYGLGGSVWTRDLERGERFARRMACGSAFVNGLVKSDPRLPFGGIKASGFGRELSRDGLLAFTNTQSIWIA